MAKVDSSFPVNNLEELVNSSTSKWITISGTALEASIKVTLKVEGQTKYIFHLISI